LAENGRERAERENVAGNMDTECKKRERERHDERVWNDYLSFKTNSRVSAKSFANQKGAEGRGARRGSGGELRREGKGGGSYGGEIIC